jgi:hypothetical protein
MTDGMPYHLEKGPTLGLIESYLNRADKREVLRKLRLAEATAAADADASAAWVKDVLPDLWVDEAFAKVPDAAGVEAGAESVRAHIIEDWFGYSRPTKGAPWELGPPSPAPTGRWVGYRGDVNQIVRRALRWGLEVSLGLMPDQDPQDPPAHPDPATIELFWVCGIHWFEAWVVQRTTTPGGRLVSIIFVTPPHKGATVATSPIAVSPKTRVDNLREPVPSTEDYYEVIAFPPAVTAASPSGWPRPVDRAFATWVVTHERHQQPAQFKNNADTAGVGIAIAPPILADYEGIGGPVVVSPSVPAGGVSYDGWIRP